MDFDDLDDVLIEKRHFIDTALEGCEHAKVKIWLLDNAIRQYTSVGFFKKKKNYLPDQVFSRPGMTEAEMTAVMVVRGANRNCIQYARRKYEEAHEIGDVQPLPPKVQSSNTTEATTESPLSSSASGSSYFHKSWNRVKKLFT